MKCTQIRARVEKVDVLGWNKSLETPMPRAEYIRIHSKYFPPDIRALYQIDGLISKDGYFYINIKKDMYILKEAFIIAYKKLIENKEPHGHFPVPFTTGLWVQ